MKILSPLDSIDEVDGLVEAGADEFYCGLLENEWHDRYPVTSINRRPAGKGHFRSFSDLKEAVRRSHLQGIKVFFTLNEHYYIKNQYPLLVKYIEGALKAEIDAFIISDYGLIAYLMEKNYGIPVHISTGGTVFNWRSVKFYKELGVERITFPRHLDIEEIEGIIARMPSIETTVFIINSRCINVDGFCTFQHGLAGREIIPMYRNACMLPFKTTVYRKSQGDNNIAYPLKAAMLERQKIWQKAHVDDYPCGACALYEFNKMGITSIKIVGRGNPFNRKRTDLLFIKKLLTILKEQAITNISFRNKAQKLYQKTYERPCRLHMCYYPSVMLES
jgi:collagenase-like PrtC family protease